nr:MAG TPA: hypothetical protein [Bacteriophage sp.]
MKSPVTAPRSTTKSLFSRLIFRTYVCIMKMR